MLSLIVSDNPASITRLRGMLAVIQLGELFSRQPEVNVRHSAERGRR